jgi:isopentenyl-diphosphate delta-isomerase
MIGYFYDEPLINSEEVESWKWMAIADIKQDMQENPDQYTIWFKIIFNEFSQHFDN